MSEENKNKKHDTSITGYFGESDSGVKIDESDRLKFAKNFLAWIGLIIIGVFIAYALYPDNTALQGIFELVKIGALPLVTLIVGFYFPNGNGNS